jgi:hypothetical protein
MILDDVYARLLSFLHWMKLNRPLAALFHIEYLVIDQVARAISIYT